MPLWKIEPVADPEDPRWLDHPRWDEVVVRADSAGAAVATAARGLGPPALRVGNESPPERTGFEDVKLYRVRRIENGDRASAESPPQVVSAIRGGDFVDLNSAT